MKDTSDWVLQEETGQWVNSKTGEVMDAPWRYMEPGSEYRTAKQVERNREYGKMMRERHERELQNIEKKRIRSEQEKILGTYIFSSSDKDTFSDLSPDMLSRAVYLATFLGFNDDTLWASKCKQMKKSDLYKLMGLGKTATDTFWKKVNGKYFCIGDDGFLHTLGSAFVMGRLLANRLEEYQKIYTAALQELYRKIAPKQHKRLGYALKMLPYLNFEYNILCHDPTVITYSEIKPLTMADFCEKIGFDIAHVSQLAADYGKLTFTVDGEQQTFCKFLGNGMEMTTSHIYINPRLIYKGSDFRKVAAIGISFAANSKPI